MWKAKSVVVGWIALTLAVLSPAAQVGATIACDVTPGVISTPNHDTRDNYLIDVSASSASDAWAVGARGDYSTGSRAVTEHWDGASWQLVPSPNPAVRPHDNELIGVADISPSDAWAVGDRQGEFGLPLIEHWDGSSWTQVKGAKVTGGSLSSIDARSATDVWAAGVKLDKSRLQPVIEHYNGKQWSNVETGINRAELFDISLGATDAWAVGEDGNGNPVAMHFDGTSWAKSPMPAASGGNLISVAEISPSDVWAVGNQDDGTGYIVPLILHWNGTSWSRMQSQWPVGLVFGIAAVSSTDVWLFGDSDYLYIGSGPGATPHVEHWNGASLSRVSVSVPSGSSVIKAAALPDGHVWTAGAYKSRGVARTLVLQACGA